LLNNCYYAASHIPGFEDYLEFMLDCKDEIVHVRAKIREPGEYPEMDRVVGSSRVPMINCVTEFGNDDLFEEVIVNEAREERRPGFQERDDGLGIVRAPCVVDY
jgi:hypothetical protein